MKERQKNEALYICKQAKRVFIGKECGIMNQRAMIHRLVDTRS